MLSTGELDPRWSSLSYLFESHVHPPHEGLLIIARLIIEGHATVGPGRILALKAALVERS